MLEYIMLGFLMYGEMSGYDLKQSMLRSTSNFFDASFGSIYPALRKMEVKGVVTSKEVIEGGKYKKLYVISDNGKLVFMNWLDQPVDFSKKRPDHLVKIFFFGFLPKENAIEKLRIFIKEVEKVLSTLKEHENEETKKGDIYQISTLKFGIDFYKFVINWSMDLLNKLEIL